MDLVKIILERFYLFIPFFVIPFMVVFKFPFLLNDPVFLLKCFLLWAFLTIWLLPPYFKYLPGKIGELVKITEEKIILIGGGIWGMVLIGVIIMF